MLLAMIFGAYLLTPQPVLDYLGSRQNENPHFSKTQELKSNCRVVKDTSDSWIKNDRYTCN